MFTELMPLLKQRILVLTISRVDDELICVTVIPKKRDDIADENTALTIPQQIQRLRSLVARVARRGWTICHLGRGPDCQFVISVQAEGRRNHLKTKGDSLGSWRAIPVSRNPTCRSRRP
jgi:hypothetical protein